MLFTTHYTTGEEPQVPYTDLFWLLAASSEDSIEEVHLYLSLELAL